MARIQSPAQKLRDAQSQPEEQGIAAAAIGGPSFNWQAIPLPYKLLLGALAVFEIINFSNIATLGMVSMPVFRDIKEIFLIQYLSPEIAVSDILAVIMAGIIIGVPIGIFHAWLAQDLLIDPKAFWHSRGKRALIIVGVAVLYGIWHLEVWNFTAAEVARIGEIQMCDPATNPFCRPEEIQRLLTDAKNRLKNAEFYGSVFTAMNLVLAAGISLTIHHVLRKFG